MSMKIVDQGRQRDYETGDPVDHVEIEDSEYEVVTTRRIGSDTLVVAYRTEDGEEKKMAFEIDDQHYVGIRPLDKGFGGLDEELRAVLNYIGYAEVAPDDEIEVSLGG